MLTDIVEAIWDWQVTDGAAAQTLRGLRLPSASPLFVVHYRAPMWSDWPLSSGHHRQVVIGIQTRLTELRPSGPVGCVTVRLRPEAAARLTGAAIAEFVDAKIELNDLFDSGEVALRRDVPDAPPPRHSVESGRKPSVTLVAAASNPADEESSI